jgi:hypothetical protein
MSHPSDGVDEVRFQVSGAELVLLSDTSLLAGTWSFERPSARAQLAPDKRGAILEASDRISMIWTRVLEMMKLRVSAVIPTPREFLAKRAGIRAELGLTREHVRLCAWALRVCHEEFVINWREFRVVAPGYGDWYGIVPDDLLSLAEKLEGLLESSVTGNEDARRTAW